ncbi:MAG: DNA polymerase III subunit delta [Cyclobacteriaceae bacterium]|nr:DNA polymerase III subunit delta [Cyclobacteriaceae bacterium]
MEASVKKIVDKLKTGKYDPVYFLQGEESYFIDYIADYIEQYALTDAEKSFNQVVVYGKDVAMATVLTHARRFPMMAERQVVIVKEAQDIQDIGRETGAKLLLEYLKQPVSSTVLVFCHKHKSLDKRKELGKTIGKLATTISGKKLYDNQLPEFISDYAREKEVSLDAQAAYTLCQFVGNDLSRLTNEFDKVSLLLKPGETITAEMVMSHVGVSKEYNIFELQKSVIQRDNFMAARIVNYFGQNTKRNPVIPAVAFLYSFFSKLLIAAQASDKSEKGLVSSLKISPYAVRDYSQALQNYPLIKITENIMYLKTADLQLKGVDSGSADDEQILRELVYKLMN